MEVPKDSGRDELPIKVIYIAGWGRSGSTLLGNILNEVEGFFFTGELRYLWEHGLLQNHLCGCGRPVQSCPIWAEVIEQALGHLDRAQIQQMADLRDAATQPRRIAAKQWLGWNTKEADVSRYLDVKGRIYRAIAQATGCRCIVDSSKTPGELHLIQQIPGVELYALHLVRDARGCAYSWRKKTDRQDTDAQEMSRRALIPGTLRWGLWNALIGSLGRTLEHYYLLHYEALADEPMSSIRSVVEWVGESGAEKPFRTPSTVTMSGNHTIWGNPNRVDSGDVEIVMDQEWKRQQPAGVNALVSLVGLPGLLEYGYPLAQPRIYTPLT